MSEQDDEFNSFHTEGDPDLIRRWEGSGADMRLVEIDTAEKMQGIVIDSLGGIGSEFTLTGIDLETYELPDPMFITEPAETESPEPPKVKRRGVNKYKSSYGPPNRRR